MAKAVFALFLLAVVQIGTQIYSLYMLLLNKDIIIISEGSTITLQLLYQMYKNFNNNFLIFSSFKLCV